MNQMLQLTEDTRLGGTLVPTTGVLGELDSL